MRLAIWNKHLIMCNVFLANLFNLPPRGKKISRPNTKKWFRPQKSPKDDKAQSEPADKIVAVAKPSTAKSSTKPAAAKGAKKAPAKKK